MGWVGSGEGREKKERKSPAIDPTDCGAASLGKSVRQERY